MEEIRCSQLLEIFALGRSEMSYSVVVKKNVLASKCWSGYFE